MAKNCAHKHPKGSGLGSHPGYAHAQSKIFAAASSLAGLLKQTNSQGLAAAFYAVAKDIKTSGPLPKGQIDAIIGQIAPGSKDADKSLLTALITQTNISGQIKLPTGSGPLELGLRGYDAGLEAFKQSMRDVITAHAPKGLERGGPSRELLGKLKSALNLH